METTSGRRSVDHVMITGMGLVCTIGETLDNFASSLKTGHSGICELSENSQFPVNAAALLGDFDFDQALDALVNLPSNLISRAKKIAKRQTVVVKSAMYSALSAWQHAALDHKDIDMDRVGLILAGHNLNSRYIYENYKKYDNNLDYLPASYGLRFFDTCLIGILSEILEINGPGFNVGAASASGNLAVIQAAQLVRAKQVDICLVVGAMADCTLLELQAFYNMGALGPKTLSARESSRPFDSAHEGFVYGQGSAAIIVECEEHMEQRNAEKQSVIAGTASCLDGNHMSNPSVNGEAKVMRKAIASAGKDVTDIDYINTHGTSSILGDHTEIDAINDVFKKHTHNIWVNATKELTGHCLYSAGVIETIATVLQLQQGFVHPNVNLVRPIDAGVRFVGQQAKNANIRCALSNSFGFGGINSSILITKE